jgi:hypothetical protein
LHRHLWVCCDEFLEICFELVSNLFSIL